MEAAYFFKGDGDMSVTHFTTVKLVQLLRPGILSNLILDHFCSCNSSIGKLQSTLTQNICLLRVFGVL